MNIWLLKSHSCLQAPTREPEPPTGAMLACAASWLERLLLPPMMLVLIDDMPLLPMLLVGEPDGPPPIDPIEPLMYDDEMEWLLLPIDDMPPIDGGVLPIDDMPPIEAVAPIDDMPLLVAG